MAFFRWWRRPDDLNAEIRSHLDLATEDHVARGTSRRDAVAKARRDLGNVGQIQEATRDVWGWRWLEHLVQDGRYAIRVFTRNPGFAVGRRRVPGAGHRGEHRTVSGRGCRTAALAAGRRIPAASSTFTSST